MLLPEAETDARCAGLAPTFDAWLRKQVAENVGYDQIVREILTVRLGGAGPARRERPTTRRPSRRRWPSTSPRTASPRTWRPARRGSSSASGSNAPSATTIPFAEWKRDQFWGLAAFFAGVAEAGQGRRARPDPRVADRRELAIPGTSRSSRRRSSTARSRSGGRRPTGASCWPTG